MHFRLRVITDWYDKVSTKDAACRFVFRYNVRISVENSLLDNSTYQPQYDNATVLAAIGINDSTIVIPPFLKTNFSQLISLLPHSGKSLLIIIIIIIIKTC